MPSARLDIRELKWLAFSMGLKRVVKTGTIIAIAILAGCQTTATYPEFPEDPAVEAGHGSIPSAAQTELRRVELQKPGGSREVTVPAVTQSVERRAVKTPELTVERVVPAVTQSVETKRLVEPERVEERVAGDGSVELVTVPAQFETVTETVVVKEATTELVTVPAQYETVTETVVVQDARKEVRYEPPAFGVTQGVADVATRPFSWTDVSDAGNYATFIPPITNLAFYPDTTVFTGDTDSDASLRDVHDRIVSFIEAEQDENLQWRLLRYPSGFVILTSPERIDEDARPIKVDGNRIASYAANDTGFLSSIRRFFKPDDERFRAISFLVRQGKTEAGPAFQSGADVGRLIAASSQTSSSLRDYLSRYYLKHHNFQVEVGVHEFEKIIGNSFDAANWSQFHLSSRPFTLAKHRKGSDIIKRADQTLRLDGSGARP